MGISAIGGECDEADSYEEPKPRALECAVAIGLGCLGIGGIAAYPSKKRVFTVTSSGSGAPSSVVEIDTTALPPTRRVSPLTFTQRRSPSTPTGTSPSQPPLPPPTLPVHIVVRRQPSPVTPNIMSPVTTQAKAPGEKPFPLQPPLPPATQPVTKTSVRNPSPQTAKPGAAATKSPPRKPPTVPRPVAAPDPEQDYLRLRCSEDDIKDVTYVVNTLGQGVWHTTWHTIPLLQCKSRLNNPTGDKPALHPYKFLEIIFTIVPKLHQHIPEIWKSNLKSGFMGGVIEGMKREKDTLIHYLEPFAKRVGTPAANLQPFIQASDWEGVVGLLINPQQATL